MTSEELRETIDRLRDVEDEVVANALSDTNAENGDDITGIESSIRRAFSEVRGELLLLADSLERAVA